MARDCFFGQFPGPRRAWRAMVEMQAGWNAGAGFRASYMKNLILFYDSLI